MRTISETRHRARKTYPCDACAWFLRAGLTDEEIDSDEHRAVIAAASEDKYCILPGQMYIRAVYIDGNEFIVYRARPEMNDVCIDLDLFDE